MLLDIGRDVDRLDTFKSNSPRFTPIEKTGHGVGVSATGIFIPDMGGKKF